MTTSRVAALLALLAPWAAHAVPMTFTQQGRLLDSAGEGISMTVPLTFSLYDSEGGETAVWTETQSTRLDNGYYNVELGGSVPLDPTDFDLDTLYLGIAVDGVELGLRQSLGSVPFALQAAHAQIATHVSGGIVDASEVRINGNTVIDGNGRLTAGGGLQSMQVFTSSGTWTRPDGISRIEVIVTGGGGGGGSHNTDDASGGGGAGGTAIEIIDVSEVSSVPVTVGVGGAGSCGNLHNGGTAGGTSSFGTFLQATGGASPQAWGVGGVAGVGSGGDLNLYGSDGSSGNIDGSGNSEAGGSGGVSYWGGSGSGGTHWGARRGGAHGSGGGGTHVSTNNCGAAGGGGIVVVREYGG